MSGRILVGLDMAEHVGNLTELAIRCARGHECVLVGLAIVDEPGIRAIEPEKPVGGTPGVDPVYYVGYHARMTAVHRQAEHLLRQFAEICAKSAVAHEEVKRVGDPIEWISADAKSCDLVVLAAGFHFRVTAQDARPDESLRKLLKRTPRPIIVVPAGPLKSGPIVIAYDDSPLAARALAAFQATKLGASGEIHIISVDSNGDLAARHATLGRMSLEKHGIRTVIHPVASPDPPDRVILEQVEHLNAGLLVMGAYGRRAVREFFLGSVTHEVLHNSRVPLLLFH